MEQQFDHLTRLVDDLLDASRITRGKIEVRKEVVDLSSIIATAIKTSRPAIEGRGHQLAVSVPKEPIVLHADRVRLAQVLVNLLNNAARYTPEGGQISLTLTMAGNDAVISIRDTGLGIPAAMQERVFDMFVQGDDTVTGSQGGLGIGLTLANSLVKLHGGEIRVHSEGRGRGSEFCVLLPVNRSLRIDVPTPASPGRDNAHRRSLSGAPPVKS